MFYINKTINQNNNAISFFNEVKLNRPINPVKFQVFNYLLTRCQNIYDAQDVWNRISNRNNNLSCFKNVIEILNGSVYKTQFKMLKTIDMQYELNEIGLSKNNFWVLLKRDVSALVYDVFWLYHVEGFSIHEISQILNKNHYWIKLKLSYFQKYSVVKQHQIDMQSRGFLRIELERADRFGVYIKF